MNEADLQWLTGFTEGDGSVMLLKSEYKAMFTRVAYGQQDREPLDFIATLFNSNVRQTKYQYELVYAWSKSIPLIETFIGNTVSEHFTDRLNIALDFHELPRVEYTTPTLDWLAGFFDAEGWSSNSPELMIEQKEYHVLKYIQEAFGGSIISCYTKYPLHTHRIYRWFTSGNKSRQLAQDIADRSHYSKKSQQLLQNYNGPSAYENRRDIVLKQRAKYYLENKEKINAHGKEYRQRPEVKEKARIYHRLWSEANRDKINAQARERWRIKKDEKSN